MFEVFGEKVINYVSRTSGDMSVVGLTMESGGRNYRLGDSIEGSSLTGDRLKARVTGVQTCALPI